MRRIQHPENANDMIPVYSFLHDNAFKKLKKYIGTHRYNP